MTSRAKVAWSIGAVGLIFAVTVGLLHATLKREGGRIEHLATADRILIVGGALSLGALTIVGIFLWRAAAQADVLVRAERSLREREQMLSSINANLEGTCVYRMNYFPDGRMECVYASPNIESLIGLPSAHFVGDARKVFGFIHAEDLPAFRGAIASALATGKPASIAVRVRHPDGRELWMQFRSHLCERRADGVQVRDGVVVDVTHIKSAETELRATRERLALALRVSRTTIWENYITANRVTLDETWAEILGRPRATTETTGRALMTLAHPEDRAAIFAATRRVYRGETDDFVIEHRVRTVIGGWAWISAVGRVTARNERGRAVRMFGTTTDITARREAEERVRGLNADLERLVSARTAELATTTERLAISERHYRSLVENISQGYHVADRRSLFTYANASLAAVAGVPAEELIGTSVFRLVADEDRERVIATYRAWVEDGLREGTVEFRVPTCTGRVRWVEQTSQIIRDAMGELVAFHSVMRDITDRKSAEAQAQLSNERFRAVFERSPIMIGLLTVPDGRLVEVNSAGLAAFGYSRAECIGRTTVELGLWADPGDRELYMAELMSKGHVTNVEARMRRKNGELFLATYSCSLIEISGQTYSLNSLLDITAQRESEARLAHVLEATTDGIWDWNIRAGTVHYSAQWCRLLGYEPGEISPRVEEFFPLLHPDDIGEVRRVLDEHLAGLTPVKQGEVRLRAKSGEYRWFLDRGKVVARDAHGAPLRMVGTISDITSRKQAEAERERLQARMRATHKMEAMGTLAGGIAHDFNNILSGVINYSTLARDECPGTHPQLQKYMAAVIACGHRAKDLVRQILLFSRAEEGGREPVLAQDVVQEAISLLRSTQPASARIEASIDARTPIVLANASQLHQVVMNLGINAVQSLNGQPGKITVRLGACAIDAAALKNLPDLKPGPHAHLEITDTGCGIDEAILGRIFDPFFTTKPTGQGTGLGLAVVHGIVRGHGGAITVRSQPGAGSTFEVFLPAHESDAAPARRLPEVPPRGAGQSILLVDDEQIVLETMQLLLERLGYKVTACLDAVDAWHRFEREPAAFDALISDYMMPVLTGAQLAERLVALRPSLPVLLCSGFFPRHSPEEMRRLNIAAFVQKPIELDQLAAALARAFGRAPALTPINS